MPTNIKFNYLYRDASNYKQHGSIVYSNPNSVSLDIMKKAIIPNLIDGEFFVASDWELPSLLFETLTEDDHEWHEFASIELTDDEPQLSIEYLLSLLQ